MQYNNEENIYDSVDDNMSNSFEEDDSRTSEYAREDASESAYCKNENADPRSYTVDSSDVSSAARKNSNPSKDIESLHSFEKIEFLMKKQVKFQQQMASDIRLLKFLVLIIAVLIIFMGISAGILFEDFSDNGVPKPNSNRNIPSPFEEHNFGPYDDL